MVGKTKAQTKGEARFAREAVELGCIACRMRGREGVPAQFHHIVEGGKRLGHLYGIPLCPWHHVGEPPPGADERMARDLVGPSMKLEKRAFVEEFGSERELLSVVREALGMPLI